MNIADGHIDGVYLAALGVELGEGTLLSLAASLVNTEGGLVADAQADQLLAKFQTYGLTSDGG